MTSTSTVYCARTGRPPNNRLLGGRGATMIEDGRAAPVMIAAGSPNIRLKLTGAASWFSKLHGPCRRPRQLRLGVRWHCPVLAVHDHVLAYLHPWSAA